MCLAQEVDAIVQYFLKTELINLVFFEESWVMFVSLCGVTNVVKVWQIAAKTYVPALMLKCNFCLIPFGLHMKAFFALCADFMVHTIAHRILERTRNDLSR